jgi:hypothetical protein
MLGSGRGLGQGSRPGDDEGDRRKATKAAKAAKPRRRRRRKARTRSLGLVWRRSNRLSDYEILVLIFPDRKPSVAA